MNTSDAFYEGAAWYGRFDAIVGAVVGSIVCCIIIGFGVYLITNEKTLTESTPGTVKKASTATKTCNAQTLTTTNNGVTTTSTNYRCELEITFEVNGATYTDTRTITSGTDYTYITNVTIYYNPANPNEFEIHPELDPKLIGGIMLGAGVLGLIATWTYTYFVFKSKTFAAVTGGVAAIGDVARIFT